MNEQFMENTNAAISSELVQQAAQEVANPKNIIDAAIEAQKSDPGAIFAPPVLDALRGMKVDDPAEFERYRARIKQLGSGVRVGELDRLLAQESQAEASVLNMLVVLARKSCQLCHDADRKGIAVIERGDHREVWMVGGPGFKNWLRGEYFLKYEAGVAETTLISAICTINAVCVYQGEQVEVHARCAKSGDSYYIDLCDAHWRAIKVGPSGYELLDRSPVLFTRNDMMRPLPEPQSGGELDLLWKYANVPAHQRPLVVAWLLDSIRPDTPFPVIELVGEQGSAKSTSQRHLRDLVDPNKVPLRGSPKSIEDIYVAAASNWIVSYENLSFLRNEQQDALCTLSTGGGFATRLFYTNADEHVLEAKRPVMLNGIGGVVTRPDLIERTIRVDAPSIPVTERREDTDITAAWEVDRPKIFGAMLERFSAVLRILPEIKLAKRQRMADFERLGEANMRIEGHAPGAFSLLYEKAVMEGTERALENFGIANALVMLMAEGQAKTEGKWSGTVGALYQILDSYGTHDRSNWPKSVRGLSEQLKRVTPALRAEGLEIVFGRRDSTGRNVTITRRKDVIAPQAPTSAPPAPADLAAGVAASAGSKPAGAVKMR